MPMGVGSVILFLTKSRRLRRQDGPGRKKVHRLHIRLARCFDDER